MVLDLLLYNIKKGLSVFGYCRYLSTLVIAENEDLKGEGKYIKRNRIWIYYLSSIIILLIVFWGFKLTGFSHLIDFLKTIITLPLLLVGIVIPVIILLINVIEKRIDAGFMHVYFQYLEPLSVLRLAIVALFVCIVLYFFGTLNFGFNISTLISISPTPFYGALIISSLIVPLMLTFLVVTKIVKSVSNDIILYNQIYNYFRKKMINVVFDVVGDEYFKKNLSKISDNHIILNNTFVSINKEYLVLQSNKTGIVIDIDIHLLKKIVKLLKNKDYEIIITTSPGHDIPSYAKNIAYFKSNERSPKIEKYLKQAIIINENEDYLKDFIDDFQKLNILTINAIKENNEERFKRFINIYLDCLDRYVTLLNKNNVKIEDSDDYFALSYPIHIIEGDIREFISLIDYERKKLLMTFRLKLYNIAKKSVEYNDYLIFKLILRLLTSMYTLSTNNKVMIGQETAIAYHNNLLYEISSYLEKIPTKMSEYDAKNELIIIIFKNLLAMFRNSIERTDYMSSKKICDSILNPSLNYNINSLIQKEVSLKEDIKELDLDSSEYKRIIENLEVIDKLYNFQETIEENLYVYYYEMGTIILKNINIEKLWEEDILKDCLISILNHFPTHKKFLEITLEFNKDRFYIDDYKILFFCLGELQFLETLKSTPPLKFIHTYLEQIKSIAELLENNYEKLGWLNLDVRKSAKNLIIMCENSSLKSQNIIDEKIIKSPLNGSKIDILKNKLKKFYEKSSIFESIFKKYNITESEKLKLKTNHVEFHSLEHKSFFIGTGREDALSAIVPQIYQKFIEENKNFKDIIILKEIMKNNITKKLISKN